MKKSVLFILLILLMSSIVSAGLFSGVWQDYFTGRQVAGESEDKFSANLIIGNSGVFYLNVGDEVLVEGKMIKLMTVSPDLVTVSVDSKLGSIPRCETNTISGIEIRYEPASCQFSAILIVGNIGKYDLYIGNEIKVEGKTVKLMTVGEDSVSITVDNVLDSISRCATKTINGIEIRYEPAICLEVVESISPQFRANLIIGNSGPYYLDMGDEVLVEGKMIKLMTVGPDLVTVSVDSKLGSIPRCETNTISGIEIRYEPAACEIVSPIISTEIVPIKEISPNEVSPEGIVTPSEPVKIISTQVCNGCLVGDVCAPFGMRLKGQYCDISKNFLPQKELKESCENSYECKSNECSNSECISTAGLLQKILDILSRFFGGK